MTTATAVMNRTDMEGRPRRSLEELVDRLFEAMGFETETETADPSAARSIHEARRLRQAGDVDGGLSVLAGMDMAKAEEQEARWAFSEWKQLLRRKLGDMGALVYSQGRGRAAALVPAADGATLEVAAQPAGAAPARRVRVMGAVAVDIPALKSRHPLAEMVEAAGVRLGGGGRVRQGVCPFHDELEGSFTVYGDSERWYCFGCGLGGDVLDFMRRIEGLSLPEAIRRLDDSPGLAPGAVARTAPVRRPRASALPPRDPALLAAAARFYAGRLRRDPAGLAYLASRGVGLAAARRLGLGFAPGGGLLEALESAGFDAGRIGDCGLFTERGSERFAGMVVVPELSGGLVRWLAGRAVDPGRTPRFQALPGPRPVLGLGRLGPAPPLAVVAEGVFDWLALASWGVPACAALGTQGVERVASALRGCPRIFLAFDADDAGREATERLGVLLGRRAAPVALPGAARDVAELACLPRGREVFLRLLARAARSAR